MLVVGFGIIVVSKVVVIASSSGGIIGVSVVIVVFIGAENCCIGELVQQNHTNAVQLQAAAKVIMVSA